MEFSVCDWVYLKLRPHRQQSLNFLQSFTDLFSSWNVLPCCLQTSTPRICQDTSHFSHFLAQTRRGNLHVEATLPPGLEMDSSTTIVPVKCLATRTIHQNGQPLARRLIQWQHSSPEEATWEDSFSIKSNFPDFPLEDKPNLNEGEVDSNQPTTTINTQPTNWTVYSRRNKRHV